MFKKTLLGILVLSAATSVHTEVSKPTTLEVLQPAIAFALIRYYIDELIVLDEHSSQEDRMANAISMGAQVAQTLSQTAYGL